MARKRDTGPQLDRPGQKPLLQGHLQEGGVRPGGPSSDNAAQRATPAQRSEPMQRSAQPAEDVATSPNQADAVSGKATKSPADVATRPHLEGSEQGPA